MANQLAEFLEERKGKTKSVDWRERKDEWVAALHRLQEQINELLEPSRKSGVASLRIGFVNIAEDHLGPYIAPELTLSVGDEKVIFTPKGLRVFGTEGMVEVKGDRDAIPLIRHTSKGFDQWEFLLQRVPDVVTVPLDEHSLVQALQRVMAP